MNPFENIQKIGEGTMGKVYLIKKKNTNEYYALKIIDRAIIERPDIRKSFERERQFLNELHNINIIKLYDVRETPSHYYLTLEYCNGGSLLKCLKKYIKMYGKPFSEEIVQYIMNQIVNGLKCIHQHSIIHRDLKLDNILVKFYSNEDIKNLNMMKTHIKISDFGISIKADLAFTAAGTPAYTDPLILKKLSARNDLKNSEGYDKSADIWSLGAMCYEMLLGRRVFNGRNIDDLSKKVEDGYYTVPFNLSKEVISFINGMLQYDPQKRLTIEKLSKHDFLKKNIKQFSKVNLDLFGSKVEKKGIKINIKKNQTIWDILNDEEKISAINRILNLQNYDEFSQCEDGVNRVSVPIFPVEGGLSKKNNNENQISNNAIESNFFGSELVPKSNNNSQNGSTKDDNTYKNNSLNSLNKNAINNNQKNVQKNYQNNFNNNSKMNIQNNYQNNFNNNSKMNIQNNSQNNASKIQNNFIKQFNNQNNYQIYQNVNYQAFPNNSPNQTYLYNSQYYNQNLTNNNQAYQNGNQIYNNNNQFYNNISNTSNQKYPDIYI